MIRRGPVLPSRRIFAWSSGMILGAISIASIIVATQRQVVSPLMAIVLPVGASALGLAAIMGALEILKRLETAGWKTSEPKLRNWLLYLGGIGLAGCAIGVFRGQMMLSIEGPSASEWLLAVEFGLCTYGALMVAVVLDLQTHFEQTALLKREDSRRAVRSLFESREAWIQARDRRRDELHRILNERVEPQLAALHGALAPSLARPTLSADELNALCDRLDRLRDAEIRQLSHLTHPSIIDVGLHPALRGLARRYRGRIEVGIPTEVSLMEALSPPLRLTIYRIVELLLENAAASGAGAVQIGLAGDAPRLTLEVMGARGALDFERARREGQLAILEARVALLDGDWQILEGDEGSGIRIRLSAAPAGAYRT